MTIFIVKYYLNVSDKKITETEVKLPETEKRVDMTKPAKKSNLMSRISYFEHGAAVKEDKKEDRREDKLEEVKEIEDIVEVEQIKEIDGKWCSSTDFTKCS